MFCQHFCFAWRCVDGQEVPHCSEKLCLSSPVYVALGCGFSYTRSWVKWVWFCRTFFKFLGKLLDLAGVLLWFPLIHSISHWLLNLAGSEKSSKTVGQFVLIFQISCQRWYSHVQWLEQPDMYVSWMSAILNGGVSNESFEKFKMTKIIGNSCLGIFLLIYFLHLGMVRMIFLFRKCVVI